MPGRRQVRRPSRGSLVAPHRGLLLTILPILLVLLPIFNQRVVGDNLTMVDGRHSRDGGYDEYGEGCREEDGRSGSIWDEYVGLLLYLGFHGVAVAGPDDSYTSQHDGKFNIEEFQLMAILDSVEDGHVGPKTCLRIGLKCYHRVGYPEVNGYLTYMRAKSGDGDTLHIIETNMILYCGVHDTEQEEAKMKGILLRLAKKLLAHGL